MSRLVSGSYRRRGRWWNDPRPEPAPTGEGYRSSKRAIAAGMRSGLYAFKRAQDLRIGDCDEIKKKALEFVEHYLAADPELIELRMTPMDRRPLVFQAKPKLRFSAGMPYPVKTYEHPEGITKDKLWQDTLTDLSEGAAYETIDREWFRMGCQPGKKLVVLPPGFGRLRRLRGRS